MENLDIRPYKHFGAHVSTFCRSLLDCGDTHCQARLDVMRLRFT